MLIGIMGAGCLPRRYKPQSGQVLVQISHPKFKGVWSFKQNTPQLHSQVYRTFVYKKHTEFCSTLSPPSSKKNKVPLVCCYDFFLPPTTSPRPFGLFFLDERSAIGFSNLQVIEIKETTAFAWFLRLLACSHGKSTYPPIKGNQWSIIPDHKAGYFWGGGYGGTWPGGGRLTSHQTGFLEIHLEWLRIFGGSSAWWWIWGY